MNGLARIVRGVRLGRLVARKAIIAGVLGVALSFGVGSTAHAQRVIGYEVGCVDWNIEQGCMEYLGCFVFDDGTYTCRSSYRGRDF